MMTLGLFAKYPEPGKTKTRLAKKLGPDIAARFSAAFTMDLMIRLPQLACPFFVCATPETPASIQWFRGLVDAQSLLRFQPDVGLGERIDWFFQTAFDGGAGEVLLVGSDSPDLPSTVIAQAADRLKFSDVVFCPSTDGGYTLVGMNAYYPKLLNSVRYSSVLTLNDSIDCVRAAGLTCELLPPWYDIDEIEDLCLLESRIRMNSGVREECAATSDVFAECWPDVCRVLSCQ